MPVYNKLVRDRIPEIIHNSGKNCTIEILDDEKYVLELKKKLEKKWKNTKTPQQMKRLWKNWPTY